MYPFGPIDAAPLGRGIGVSGFWFLVSGFWFLDPVPTDVAHSGQGMQGNDPVLLIQPRWGGEPSGDVRNCCTLLHGIKE